MVQTQWVIVFAQVYQNIWKLKLDLEGHTGVIIIKVPLPLIAFANTLTIRANTEKHVLLDLSKLI